MFTLRRPLPALLTGAALLAIYVIVGKLGLGLATIFPNATPVWPATGLAFVALLLLGPQMWPAVFLGAFVVNLTTAGTVTTSIGIAAGNTLEALLGAWLVNRFAGGTECLARPERIFKFLLFGALFSTLVSATMGVATLHLAGLLPRADLGSAWTTWWLGDASGDLLVAPLLISWATPRPVTWDRARVLETVVLFGLLGLVSLVFFGGIPGLRLPGPPPTFFCVPFLIWAAVRLGVREAATATALLSGFAVWGTLGGHGSFVRESPNSSLLLLQAYMGVAAVMTLMLAAAISERTEVQDQLRRLAITDPLTGIANYRHLITRLEGEITRSDRTGRPFAVLFMDVDGLKAINDRHGHLAGSRALCRVAEVLRDSARGVDTAARYGGDEFALLLPETDEEEATKVAQRLTDRLATTSEAPGVRVSLGIAVHPRDGTTPDALIGAADRRLYDARALVRGDPRKHSGPHPHVA